MSTVVFTGGHHNSALEVAKRLKSSGHKIVWIGHKFTSVGNKSVSAEFKEVTEAKIPFYELKSGKFYKVRNPFKFFKIALGFLQSFSYLSRIQPALIVSFGGYLSVPVIIAGWLLKIPSVTHEQTVTAGWANKAISPFVKKIFVTHRSSLKNYPRHKSVLTGLPLRSEITTPKKYKKPSPPLIYITGGKQGSHKLNSAVFPIIPELTKKYQVVHQTGDSTLHNDQEKARRSSVDNKRYLHQAYFKATDAARYLKTSALVVSRSGAHTTYELLYLNKKAVLVPIPWVSHDEQLKNAEMLERNNSALILQEQELNPENLLKSIQRALKLKPKIKTAVITDATERILIQLEPFLV